MDILIVQQDSAHLHLCESAAHVPGHDLFSPALCMIPLPVVAMYAEMRAVTPGATRRLFRKAVVEPVTPQ
jgi:hypothetical protein